MTDTDDYTANLAVLSSVCIYFDSRPLQVEVQHTNILVPQHTQY